MLRLVLFARAAAAAARHPALARIVFNRAFKSGRTPRRHSALLQEAVRDLSPGAALDVTTGSGRNAVFLARLGWDVTGFDLSDEALIRATASAEQAGVRLNLVRSSCADFDYGEARWDLLLLSYAWVPLADPAFTARLVRSLKPGGLLVFEHYLHTGPTSAPTVPERSERADAPPRPATPHPARRRRLRSPNEPTAWPRPPVRRSDGQTTVLRA